MNGRQLKGICLVLPLLLVAGCVSQHVTPAPNFSTLNPPRSPNSDNPLMIVNNPLTTPMKGGPSAADLAVGAQIRALLMEDKTLAPAPSNVITIVSKGVVKMTGFVRSRKAAQELHQRIASLPGVLAVDDQLTLWNGHKI